MPPGHRAWARITQPSSPAHEVPTDVREQLVGVFDALVPAPEASAAGGTGQVVAQGTFHGEPWTLMARGESQLGEGMGPVIAVVGEIPVFDAVLPGRIALRDDPATHGDTQLLGYVSADVARVEVTLDGTSSQVVLHDVPLDLANPLRAFFVPIPGGPVGSISAYQEDGTRVISRGIRARDDVRTRPRLRFGCLGHDADLP